MMLNRQRLAVNCRLLLVNRQQLAYQVSCGISLCFKLGKVLGGSSGCCDGDFAAGGHYHCCCGGLLLCCVFQPQYWPATARNCSPGFWNALPVCTRHPKVSNVTETVVGSLDEVKELAAKGEARRMFGRNNVHEHASRSHTIFQLIFESRHADDAMVRVSTLNVVDLAGVGAWK